MLVGQCQCISVASLRSKGRWKGEVSIAWRNQLTGTVTGAVDVRAYEFSPEDGLLVVTAEDGRQQEFRLEATPQHFGMHWWARCPGCGRRTDRLYRPGRGSPFLCRICRGLRYESQDKGAANVLLGRMAREAGVPKRVVRRWLRGTH